MMTEVKKAYIQGLGSYLPERILSNADLEKMVETNDEWIMQRTGVSERRLAAEDEASSDMGIPAAKRALEAAGVEAESIDLILVATMSPDYLCPSTAAIIQAAIGANRAAALDIQAACAGFLYGLSMAKAYVESGIYKKVLVIAVEKMSSVVDYSDRGTCILFGDGAAAAVIGGERKGFSIDTIQLGADGAQAELIILPAGGSRQPASQETIDQKLHYVKIQGNEVFKHAVRRMTAAAEVCLEAARLEREQIKWLVPHQANIRIMDAIAKNFGVPDSRMYKTVHKYGNTSASSVPIALDELARSGRLEKDDHILLVSFGAGLTWGASIITYL